MRTRLFAMGSLVLVLTTAAPLVVRAQNGAPAPPTAAPGVRPHRQRRERHPELMRALRTLQRAKADLMQANRDFDGHRAKAAELTEQAIQETQAAMRADRN